MRAADLLTAALLALVGVVVVVDAVRLGLGWGSDGPKSGFFPFWLAAIMIVTLAAISAQSLASRPGRPFVTRAQVARVLHVLGPATAFVVLMQVIGLYVAGALYLAVSMRWLGRHGWAVVTLVSIGIPLVVFVVFERWFIVPLPKGPLETWLGY